LLNQTFLREKILELSGSNSGFKASQKIREELVVKVYRALRIQFSNEMK